MPLATHAPWERRAATGVGSMPGTDVRESVRLVLGEVPLLPYLPELPARGPGADMTGRAVAMLVDLPGEWTSQGWRTADRPGRDLRQARALLGEDLDALQELAEDYQGPLKLQVCGPWTLAATLELRQATKAVADPGARADLVASLAEGLAAHVADVARRLPGAQLVVQLDEPALPAVLGGGVPTASGWGSLRAVDPVEVETGLRVVLGALPPPVVAAVHCCAADPPVGLLVAAGVRVLSLDHTLLGQAYDDALGEALESGVALLAGVVPALAPAPSSDPAATVGPVRSLWRRLGFDPDRLGALVAPTPTCGLAGAGPEQARQALALATVGAGVLSDDPTGEQPEAGGG